jgi:putative transposase
MVLLAHIRNQHRLSQGSYGRPRMTEELNELGFQVGRKAILIVLTSWPGSAAKQRPAG